MKKFMAVSIGFLISSCASITQGTDQLLSFSIDPIDATCKVIADSGAEIGSMLNESNWSVPWVIDAQLDIKKPIETAINFFI
jgi:hypothetical protein